MEKLIACCGINCATCDARTATITNDDALRTKTAETWAEQFASPNITAETINCTGCLEEGVNFMYCSMCEIRSCAILKSYKTCGECADMETCSILGAILQHAPELKTNLQSLN